MSEIVPTGPTVEDHNSYLGASDIGAVAGQSSYQTALDVWAEKRGVTHFEGNEFTEMGNAFERPALELYAKRHGVELSYPGTLIHSGFPWAGATPDAIADRKMVAECKIVGRNASRRWGDPEDGPDGVPAEVLCQVHWQTWIARDNNVLKANGYPAHVVAVMGTDMPVYEVPIEDEMIEGLIEIGRDFWERCIVGGEMPVIEGDHASDILAAIHPRHLRDSLDPMTAEIEKLAREYDEARDAASDSEAHQKQIGAQLKALIGEGAGFQGNGVTATWKAPKGSPSWKKIAEAAGATTEIIKRFTPEFGKRKLHVKIK